MYDSRYIKNEQQNWIYASLLLVQELLYFSFLKKSNKYFDLLNSYPYYTIKITASYITLAIVQCRYFYFLRYFK